jgi:hypothetical protein
MNREELLKNAKPILFNTEMVQAILEGRKTVTRRKIDRDITNFCDVEVDGTLLDYQNCDGDFINPVDLCRYKVGDILYVRETWSIHECVKCQAGIPALGGECKCEYVYRTNYGTTEDDSFPPSMYKWKPSIHMPKEAARIFLKVTDVRVERLQDITEEDAITEGMSKTLVDGVVFISAKGNFHVLWDSLNIKRGYGWEANPWVWVIEFERVEVENE